MNEWIARSRTNERGIKLFLKCVQVKIDEFSTYNQLCSHIEVFKYPLDGSSICNWFTLVSLYETDRVINEILNEANGY